MSRVRIVLLCEDRKTDVFVRRFLKQRKFTNRDVTTLPFAGGKGSGEAWGRNQFPKELKAIRTQQAAYLVVVLDADYRTVAERGLQLQRACEEAAVPPRNSGDPVVVAVPKRNLETWLAYLDGTDVDEETDYKTKGSGGEKECKPLADRLFEMCHREQRLRHPAPPSLEVACEEYQKLKK